MNKNTTLHTRKTAKRDPLMGAPGHAPASPVETKSNGAGSSESKSHGQVTEGSPVARFESEGGNTEAAGPVDTPSRSKMVDALIQNLGSVFGEETIEKWREVLSANTADAQAAFYSILRTNIPSLPEQFSLAEIMKLADSKPVKKVKENPVTAAATVAAGVGAFFLLRELIAGDSKAGVAVREAVSRAKEYVADAAAGVTSDRSAKPKRKKVAAVSSSSRKSSTPKGAKAKSKSPGKKSAAKISAKKSKKR